MTKFKLITIALLTLSFYLLFPQPSFAQMGLSIYPPILEATIKPGKAITQAYSIQNLSPLPKTLVAKIVPFEPSNFGLPILRPDLKPSWLNYFTLANAYIELDTPFTLQPQQKEQLVLNISIPTAAALSDHYAALVLSTNEEGNTNGGNSTLITSIGANILISVSQVENPPTILKIENFKPNEKEVLAHFGQYYFIDNLSPVHFKATAANTGAHFSKTGGLFKVTSGNKTLSLQGLLPLNVLANSTREIAASPSGEMIFKPSFTNIGLHHAIIDLRSENSSSHSQISLIFIPLKLGLGLILAFLLILMILKYSSNPPKKK